MLNFCLEGTRRVLLLFYLLSSSVKMATTRYSRLRRAISQRGPMFKTVIVLAVLVSVYFYYRFSVRGLRWYQWPYKFNDKFQDMQCPRPKAQLQAIVDLTHSAHRVFGSLGIVYSLSYGTLFGALRYEGPVPWDADADLIIMKKTIDKYSLSDLQKAFAAESVEVSYFSYGGFYLLKKNNATCDCFLFSDFYGSGWLHRVGWESYLFFINYRYNHVFPAALMETPLPTLNFGGLEMYAPRDGWTIQKYHYRDDWDQEVKPPQCPRNVTGKFLHPPPPRT